MKNLLKSLSQFHASCGPVTKEANNPFFKSKYATLDAIQEHIRTPLQKCGLTITQANKVADGQAIVVTTVWHVESGENLSSEFPVVVGKNTAQEYGSAVSYAKRYSLSGLLNLTIQDEDDDGNKASIVQQPVQEVKDDKPWLDEKHPSWDSVVKAMKTGYSITDVRKKFKVGKESEQKLKSLSAQGTTSK
jgi:hypothetical protein